jgi:hypothetical protein
MLIQDINYIETIEEHSVEGGKASVHYDSKSYGSVIYEGVGAGATSYKASFKVKPYKVSYEESYDEAGIGVEKFVFGKYAFNKTKFQLKAGY